MAIHLPKKHNPKSLPTEDRPSTVGVQGGVMEGSMLPVVMLMVGSTATRISSDDARKMAAHMLYESLQAEWDSAYMQFMVAQLSAAMPPQNAALMAAQSLARLRAFRTELEARHDALDNVAAAPNPEAANSEAESGAAGPPEYEGPEGAG